MKSKLLFAVLFVAAMLAGCSTTGSATVTYGDEKNPTRVTSVTGLESRDAANMGNNAAYYTAKATQQAPKACEIEAKPGETISGVAKITCYSADPDQAKIAAPQRAQSAFAENVEAVGNAGSKLLNAATPVVAIIEGGKTVRSMNEAAAKDPVVVQTPDPVIVRPEVILVPAGP